MNPGTAFFVLALLSASPALADAAADCDRLAASPYDPGKRAEGVAFEAIDGPVAEAACRAALAAAPGNAQLQFQLGRALDRQDKSEEARATYLAAHGAGSVVAGYGYGKLLELGMGGPVDFAGAAQYYQRALDAGLKIVAADLGYLHQEGQGFTKDAAKAAALYQVAVEAGDRWAMVNLGLLYEKGDGVPRDDTRAAALYRSGAELGDPWGQHNLGVMYQQGRGVPRDPAEAARWFRAAADKNNAPAIRSLATLYESGLGVAKDEAEAERLIREAIAVGGKELIQAQNQLAFFLAERNRQLDEAATLVLAALEAVGDAADDKANFKDTLAWVQYRQGKFEEALQSQIEAMAGLAEHPPSQDRLGDIYAALGRKAEARAAWEKALALPTPIEVYGEYDWDRAAVEKKLKDG